MKIFSNDGGSAIAYSTNWFFSLGDGGSLDTNSDFFDLSNVVSGGALTNTGFVIATAGSEFDLNGALNPTFDAPSLAIGLSAVPEPSTYALFVGLLTFGYLVIRRRR